jgi:hypothetical protein
LKPKVKAEPLVKEVKAERVKAAMMCEWVEDCAPELRYIYLGDLQSDKPVVMQMLNVQLKIKVVPSHRDDQKPSQKCWNVYPHLIHRPDLLGAAPNFVDVHADMAPRRFDVLRFFLRSKLPTALFSEAGRQRIRKLRVA